MSRISFSIIIPYYNTEEKKFIRCIESVIHQDHDEYEVIIVNDGSAKEFQNVLKDVSKKDDRIRIINKENEGSAVARNVGIVEAKHDYIMFLDSDDALTEYCLSEAAKTIEEHKADLVVGLVQKVDETTIDCTNGCKTQKIDIISDDSEKNSLLCHILGYDIERFTYEKGYLSDGPVSKILKRSIAQSSFFSEEPYWNDDTIWNIIMLKKCNKIVIVKDLWYKYLIYNGSKIRKYRPNCQEEFIYRTRQELELGYQLWPSAMQGIYTKVFNDIVILARTFLFHPENPMPYFEVYRCYKCCIHHEPYREAVKGIDFSNDTLLKRVAKQMFAFFIYKGPNIISFEMLRLFIKRRVT